MTERLAPATTTHYLGRKGELWFVHVKHADGSDYKTPLYYTPEMAIADGACWETFHNAA